MPTIQPRTIKLQQAQDRLRCHGLQREDVQLLEQPTKETFQKLYLPPGGLVIFLD